MTTRISPNLRPQQLQPSLRSFAARIEELKEERARSLSQNPNKPSIVISGGGPAGLIRGIESLLNGNPTIILEKRRESDNGRENTVLLRKNAYRLLNCFGIYQYLSENGLIFPADDGEFNVRLKDLEQAMKAVIGELTRESVVKYDSQLERIVPHPGAKADLIYRSSGRQVQQNAVDLLVVAEGAHSPTNEHLLGNHRVTVLPSIPVIAAIFKDDRPQVTGPATFFQYVGMTLANTSTSVYYYAIFLFKCFFQGEHIFNSSRKIAGSLILTTPNQNYLGSGLSREETEEMKRVLDKLKSAKAELEEARLRNPSQVALLEQKVDEAQKERDAYLNYWSAMSLCFANILNIFRCVLGGDKLQVASWLPLDHVSVAEIGADRSSSYSGSIGTTAYLIAGDTMATVDPTTGRGCNTAIETMSDFHDFILGIDANQDMDSLFEQYNLRCTQIVDANHRESVNMRHLYRPDAVAVPQNAPLRA
ncbi:MAG: hypothetical protein JSS60_05620 [Verrucomicrobia bacterium]|nr:hypothetical protein [Verrucomicrobiota bacterium]